MKYVISDKLRPPPHCFYGDSYERGSDPWHKDAFPEEFKDRMPGGPRIGGWFLVDAWGNQIGFVGDGTTIECTPTQMRKFPKDLVDELMRQGADVVADQIAENCEACGHEMSEHGPGGCAVRMDSAWTADNTKPCGCTQTVKS